MLYYKYKKLIYFFIVFCMFFSFSDIAYAMTYTPVSHLSDEFYGYESFIDKVGSIIYYKPDGSMSQSSGVYIIDRESDKLTIRDLNGRNAETAKYDDDDNKLHCASGFCRIKYYTNGWFADSIESYSLFGDYETNMQKKTEAYIEELKNRYTMLGSKDAFCYDSYGSYPCDVIYKYNVFSDYDSYKSIESNSFGDYIFNGAIDECNGSTIFYDNDEIKNGSSLIFSNITYEYQYDGYTATLLAKLRKNEGVLPSLSEGTSTSHAYPLYEATHETWNNKIKTIQSNIKNLCGVSDSEIYSKIQEFYNKEYSDIKPSSGGSISSSYGLSDCDKHLYDAVKTVEVFRKWFELNYAWSFTNTVNDTNIKNINFNNIEDYRRNEFFLFYEFYHTNNIYGDEKFIEAMKKYKETILPLIDTSWEDVYKQEVCDKNITDPCASYDNSTARDACYNTNITYKSEMNECVNQLKEVIDYVTKFHEEECKSSNRFSGNSWLGECLRPYITKRFDEIANNSSNSDSESNKYVKKAAEAKDAVIQKKSEIDKAVEEAWNEIASLIKNIKYNDLSVDIGFGTVVVDCEDFEILHVIWLIIIIMAPFLLMIFSIIDFFKVVIASDENAMKNLKKNLPKRVIALLILLIVPAIIYVFFSGNSTSNSNMLDTMKCVVKGK